MKRHIVILILLAAALVLSCKKQEEKFAAANAEVQGFSLDEAPRSAEPPPPPAFEAKAAAPAPAAPPAEPAMAASAEGIGELGGGGRGRSGHAKGSGAELAVPTMDGSPRKPARRIMAEDRIHTIEDPPAQNLPRSGQLTAGAWVDNANWDFWTGLMGKGYESHLRQWDFDISNRFVVAVKHSGNPARNVPVALIDAQGNKLWSAMTNGQGNAYLFGPRVGAGPYEVKVANLPGTRATPGQPVNVDLSQQEPPRVADSIEVMFVVDTTGSMGDELAYIQSELADVATQVRERTRNEFELRIGTAVYRDHHEQYLVQTGPFTTNVQDSVAFLNKQSAGGGGDFPEAVDEALEEVIDKSQWNPAARARLLFLVLDAPPHQDAEGKARLKKAMSNAARQGIQVIPVVGSGIDKNTEFLMRTMAIVTQGTYVFLTSHSGIGGAHIEPTTGDYEVEKLNALIVRLIAEAAS